MKTSAVVFPAANQVEFALVEAPAPRADEAVVRSEWSWISNGTEGSYLRGERCNGETPSSPERPAPFPIIAGYQRVGRVTWAGPDSGVAVGDRVFCTISRIEGLAEGYGGHVLEAPVHRDQLYAVPADGPPPEAYSGLVLTQVGYNCGVRPTIAAGDPAVVIGDGMVGQWAAQTLQQRGARVLLLGRHPDRLQRLPLAAGDAVVNTRETDDLEAVKAWAPDGVQAIIDSVGSVATLNRLFWTLRRDGHLVSAGFNGRDSLFDLQLLRFREATVHAPSGWSRQRLEATLDWVHQGRLDTLGLVTHRFPADRAVEAWDAIRGQHDTTLGVLLDWREVTA